MLIGEAVTLLQLCLNGVHREKCVEGKPHKAAVTRVMGMR
jgi:hypothetical protein